MFRRALLPESLASVKKVTCVKCQSLLRKNNNLARRVEGLSRIHLAKRTRSGRGGETWKVIAEPSVFKQINQICNLLV